jgi:hypothetical protein
MEEVCAGELSVAMLTWLKPLAAHKERQKTVYIQIFMT